MAQQVRTVKERTISFSANNKVSESLSRGSIYRELYLHLKGAPTLTLGNNTSANTQVGDEWGCIKRIDVVLNSVQTIRSFSGNDLWWLNHYWYGKAPKRMTNLGDGATANPAFDSVLIIPFWMPNARRPFDTALNSAKLSDVSVQITWGDYDDVNSAATAWTTDPTVDIYAYQSFDFNAAFAFSQFRQFVIEKEVTSTQPRFEIDLPIGNLYRSFLINTTDGGVDNGDIINNIKLKSGSVTFVELSDAILQQVPLLREAFAESYTGAAYQDQRVSDSSSINGWRKLELVGDGFLTEGLDTVGFSELKLELDVTIGGGTTNVRVIPSEIVPIR